MTPRFESIGGRTTRRRSDRHLLGSGTGGESIKSVANTLEAKGSEVFKVASGASVYEALQMLSAKNVGSLVVADGDEEWVVA